MIVLLESPVRYSYVIINQLMINKRYRGWTRYYIERVYFFIYDNASASVKRNIRKFLIIFFFLIFFVFPIGFILNKVRKSKYFEKKLKILSLDKKSVLYLDFVKCYF